MTNEQLMYKAPSIFADRPYHEQTEKYRFIPTIKVVDALRDAGFYPVKASQSKARYEKKDFTKHTIRFRQSPSLTRPYEVGGIIPEIVLVNSHDGTSAYNMMLGLFRLVCSNGLVVADSKLDSIKVRHTGSKNLCQDIIDVSGRIIEEAPKTLEVVNRWQNIMLSLEEQTAYAKAALTANAEDTTIALEPGQVLRARRYADSNDANGGHRNLWKTFNVVQENLIRGGVRGQTLNNSLMATREIKSVDRNIGLNKALWTLASEMEAIKTKQ